MFIIGEIEHYVHPDKKDHARFHEVQNVKLNLLPRTTQMNGKSDLTNISVGEAVSQGIIDNQTLGYFMARIDLFLRKIGFPGSKFRFRQHLYILF